MPNISIPPYFTAGASSRAHHSLIVSLNEARTEREEGDAVEKEVERCRVTLKAAKPSSSKVAETLIILLNCHMAASRQLDTEWALMPALQLAEGGKTLRDRRIGYRYLTERLPPDHELRLMLINTIRKDLTSAVTQERLLALNTIVKVPSPDLRPAVLPVLLEQGMLGHKMHVLLLALNAEQVSFLTFCRASIRKKTLQAIHALFACDDDLARTIGPKSFPLSLGQMTRMLADEMDNSVVIALMRTLRFVVETHLCKFANQNERRDLVEVLVAQAKRTGEAVLVGLEAMRTLEVVLKDASDALYASVVSWLERHLKAHGVEEAIDGAFILQTCRLIAALPVSLHLFASIVRLVVQRTSSLFALSSPPYLDRTPEPNQHILALRCLLLLPQSTWDGVLGGSVMKGIMEGLNHADPTVRRLTLRLLHRLSPDLPAAAFGNHLDSLRNSTNLALPLKIKRDLAPEQKIQLARQETALRALEVTEVESGMANPQEAGVVLARGVVNTVDALSGLDGGKRVWEVVVGRVMTILTEGAARSLVDVFISVILEADVAPSPTLTVLRATTAVQLGNLVPADIPFAIEVILVDVNRLPSAVQELALVAATALLAQLPHPERFSSADVVRRAIDSRSTESKYMQRRALQIQTLLGNDPLDELQEKGLRNLPDILQAIAAIHEAHRRRLSLPTTSPIPFSPPQSARDVASSVLRYDAYAAPDPSASRSKSREASKSPAYKPRRYNGSRSISAGDYTLWNAEAEEGDDLLGEHEQSGPHTNGLANNMVGLTLDERDDHPDPFKTEDPQTPRLG